jgi:FAD/FMN-containing dehydrogenase/Fe-S oxidoreductase
MSNLNLEALAHDLTHALEGEVRFEPGSRALYATDASNYRQEPLGVVVPFNRSDVEKTIRICHQHGASIVSRGGGTSLAGQGCNESVLIDMSKHFNLLRKLDFENRIAVVEPGIVLDELRNRAEAHHLTFGPDPATHSRCTLGGMIGNNSCGVHALMSGRTSENVEELEVLTYDGHKLRVGATSNEELEALVRENGRRGEIYRGLKALRDRYANLIRERYPKIPRRVSGYNLDELLPERGFHVARSLVGSEGTCITILEAKLKLVPSPQFRGLVVAGFSDIVTAAANVPNLLPLKPIGLEAIDNIIVQNILIKQRKIEDLKLLPDGNSWLLLEAGGNSPEECREKITEMEAKLRELGDVKDLRVLKDIHQQQRLWRIREAGLGVTASVPGQRDTWEGWEDSAVDPSRLASYLHDLKALYRKYDYNGALYGHFGQGCVHTRIQFDLVSAAGIRKYHSFTEEAANLVVKHGGSLSGEHGDGVSRAELLPKMFGPELVEAFGEFKRIWDPTSKMNPGRIVNPYLNTDNLRLGTSYGPWEPPTNFKFPDDQDSFARATLRCVGIGACRRHDPENEVMCPSYMVTREEKHSTRGRARLLFEMLEGKIIPPKWKNEQVKEALDLCLSCKGCKSDCPVNVDMATYKAEFLSHYYEGRLRPRSAYAMGFIAYWARLASLAPRFVNYLGSLGPTAAIARWLAGIHPSWKIPQFSSETFRSWFLRSGRNVSLRAPSPATRVSPKKVILWPDTFTNHFHPEIGRAAVIALEAGGFSVEIPKRPWCCGRPLYDYGFIATARRWLSVILKEMRPQIRAGLPFIFLEPSCGAVFREELRNLFPHDQDALRLEKQSFLLADFLLQQESYPWPRMEGDALVHGHCHHKSVFGFEGEEKALRKIYSSVQVLSSGCCGMAGSFGFEKEHYEISKAVGEYRLLPLIRKSAESTRLITNGFSCREQVRQLAGRRAWHFAEVLADALSKQAVSQMEIEKKDAISA